MGDEKRDKKGLDALKKIAEQQSATKTTDTTNTEKSESDWENASIQGWFKVKKRNLCYDGVFYPETAEITIRGALTPEIREWSKMDTDNEFDIVENFNSLLKSCCKVTGGSWKDILEVDRYKLVLMIQELTFIENPNLPKISFNCFSCDEKNEEPLNQSMIVEKEYDEEFLNKYLNTERGVLEINTKNYGVINYAPASIGATLIIMDMLKKEKPAFVKKYKQVISTLGRFLTNWKFLKVKQVKDKVIEWNAYDEKQLAMYESLRAKLDLNIEEKAIVNCKKCEEPNHTAVFPDGGLKQLFLRIEEADDEFV